MVRHILLFGVAVALFVLGPIAYRRWEHRYICIPPLPPHGSSLWMEDRMCGPADQLKEMEPVDVRQFTEPVTPMAESDKELPYDSVDCDNANGDPNKCTVEPDEPDTHKVQP